MEYDYRVAINLAHLMSEVQKGRGIRARENACRELTTFIHRVVVGEVSTITADYKSVIMTAEQFAHFISLRTTARCKNGILVTRITEGAIVDCDYDARCQRGALVSHRQRNTIVSHRSSVSTNITNLNEGEFPMEHTHANSMISQTAKNIDRIDALLTRLYQAPTLEIAGVSLLSKSLLPVVLVERQAQINEMSRAIKDSYADVQKHAELVAAYNYKN